MTTQHTPGPWAYALEYGPNITELPRITTVARCANYVIGLPSDYPGGNYRDGDPSGDEEADARLIAAAPDLLMALLEARRWIGDGDLSDGLGREYWTPEYIKAVDTIDAGIAKFPQPLTRSTT